MITRKQWDTDALAEFIISAVTENINSDNKKYFKERQYGRTNSISASSLSGCWKQIALKLEYGTPEPIESSKFEEVAYAWTGTIMHREVLNIVSNRLNLLGIHHETERPLEINYKGITLSGQADLIINQEHRTDIVEFKFPSYWQFERYKKNPRELNKYSPQMNTYKHMLEQSENRVGALGVYMSVIAIHGNSWVKHRIGRDNLSLMELSAILRNRKELIDKKPDGIVIPSYRKECQYCPFWKNKCDGVIK